MHNFKEKVENALAIANAASILVFCMTTLASIAITAGSSIVNSIKSNSK